VKGSVIAKYSIEMQKTKEKAIKLAEREAFVDKKNRLTEVLSQKLLVS